MKSTKSIDNSFRNILKGLRTTAIVAGLIKIGKTAIDTASNLEEVQNVVDVAFGESAKEINEFADTAIKKFGLSVLSAKQMASSFMAMSNGMGIANSVGKNMAKTLTGLAGDMASFYNTTTDMAYTGLSAIYTGETEALKKFGIILTEANLQQYAYSQGINKQISAMTQAEKVALRYNYVLNATAQVQGDFVRTGGNWANQIRILKEQWSQLFGILGSGLIQVLNPVVKALNEMLGSLISITNAMSKAFGGKGIEKITSNVSSSIGDVAGGFDDATESAKAFDKSLAGFDELNIIGSNSISSSGSSSSGGVGDFTVEGMGQIVEGEEQNPASKLQLYLEECKAIIDKWVERIPKLDLKFDVKQATADLKGIGLNILDTIAGWGSFIISIGIEVANDLDIGNLTNSFIGLVESATNLASTIANVLVPILSDFYKIALKPIVEWIGEKLANGIQIASGLLDDWGKWFVSNKDLISDFAKALADVVAELWELIEPISDTAWEIFTELITTLNEGLQYLATFILENKDLVIALAKAFALIKLGDLIIGFKGLWVSIQSGYGILPYLLDLLKAPIQLLTGGFITAIKNASTILLSVGQSIGVLFTGIKNAVSAVATWLIANPIALIIGAVVGLVALIAVKGDEIQAKLAQFNDWLKNIFTTDWTTTFGPIIGGVLNSFANTVSNIWDGLYQVFNGVIDFIRGTFTGDWERAWLGVKEIFKGVFDTLASVAKIPINAVIQLINGMIRGVVSGINSAISALNKIKAPDWMPGVGGKGVNIPKVNAPQIPLLANGGVITSPTVAMMGEYAGAGSNPEIVTPQSLLQNIIDTSNDDVIQAFYIVGNKIVDAINNKESNTYLNGMKVSRQLNKSQNTLNHYSGSNYIQQGV